MFAPGANETELLKSLARYRVNTIGVSVCDAAQLADIALKRQSIFIDQEIISRQHAVCLVNEIAEGNEYFKELKLEDKKNIIRAIESARSLIPENEEEAILSLSEGEFKKKNNAIIQVYKSYIQLLKQANKTDRIQVIRRAIKEGKLTDETIVLLREFPLSPLEKKLVESITQKEIKEINLTELFRASDENKGNNFYFESYGKSTEIEYILSYIYEKNLPLDECEVVLAAPSEYSQLIYDMDKALGIPMSFGCGISITNSNPGKLLSLLVKWDKEKYHSSESLYEMLCSSSFNIYRLAEELGIEEINNKILRKISALAGSLRLSLNKEENRKKLKNYESYINDEENLQILTYTKQLFEEIEQNYGYFIEKYAVREEGIDAQAASVIQRTLDLYLSYEEESIEDIVEEINSRMVCYETSKPGKLYITTIQGALSTLRKNVFICGLSSSNFPGQPKENYLLLDSDYELLDKDNAPTSDKVLDKKKEDLYNLLNINQKLNNKVYLSYSSYNLANMKDENASSVLFDIYKKENGEKATLKDFENSLQHITYFNEKFNKYREIGKAYSSDYEIQKTQKQTPSGKFPYLLYRRFSPTAIDLFFECPKHFYLSKILGLPEEEERDPFTVIQANELGTMVHEMMELKANSDITKESFLQIAADRFDEHVVKNVPLNMDVVDKERYTYLEMIENGYDKDPNNLVIVSEGKYTADHPSGILLEGTPDRVEKDKDGNCLIADFKTYTKLRNTENDYESCRQVIIYAFIMEQNDVPIRWCEYRYLRSGSKVVCNYNESMKSKLNADLEKLKLALLTNDFPCATKIDACRYCKFGSICGKGKKEDDN